MRVYVGIDNGSSGSIGIITEDGKVRFGTIPNKKEQSYTKKKQSITRVDVGKLDSLLKEFMGKDWLDRVFVLIERPMVNPTRFKASISAARALEAVLNVIELNGLSYQYIDSKEWQKALLPEGTEGTDELKKASLQIGTRLFPQVESKHKDRDGILIAEYARRKGL
jgi:hypothetical protein